MSSPEVIGRYALYGKIASGGMATVHIGRLMGPVGFSRTVAIKRMHPQFTEDPEFVSMFLDEARLAARIRHPNVVPTLDVVATANELFLVLEYIQGETLARLRRLTTAQKQRIPQPVATAIASGVLHGLHAAHEAKNERGEALGIVHRDVSPQNVIVGVDGVSRVLDFGVAKAVGRLQTTREGQLKGKLAYMAPEQVQGKNVTRRCDIYSASIVLWEALAGRRMLDGDNEAAILQKVLTGEIEPPSVYAPDVSAALDAIVLRGLSRNPDDRFATAREMAGALEAAAPVAIPPVVGAWVEKTASEALASQSARIAEIESVSGVTNEDFDARPTGRPPPRAAASTEDTRAEGRASGGGASAANVVLQSSIGAPPLRPWGSAGRRRAVLIGAAAVVLASIAAAFGAVRPGVPATAAGTSPSVTPTTPPSAWSTATASAADAGAVPLSASAEAPPPPAATRSPPAARPPPVPGRAPPAHSTGVRFRDPG